MRLRFLLPAHFIGAIRRKVKKRTISSTRRESQSSLEKLERIRSIPEIEIELPPIEHITVPELVVSEAARLEPPAELHETIHSTSSRGRNGYRNHGYSSFASSNSSHRIGYRLRRPVKKTRKSKTPFQKKMHLLAHLLPLFHDTLSMFHDVCQAAELMLQFLKSTLDTCRHLPIVVLVIFLVSSLETILTIVFSTVLLALHIYSPKIFRPRCKVRALPRISIRMCIVFQKSISLAAVGINVVSLRGGAASVSVWMSALSLLYFGQFMGYLNSFKLAILISVLLTKAAPQQALRCLKHFKKQIKQAPGTELFRTNQKK
ncbi:uncharacterized protein LOC114828126 [Galendromus occidentalis]|uniref:Uncharacterized protein LOC114828126 n=1 Tax=Galendromus occidentalis TaxID=34638 RepID=A0AAJ7SDP0_9ACAR|nr:uncharacterized protein LOC114828126 [Galendromus occidentalis]